MLWHNTYTPGGLRSSCPVQKLNDVLLRISFSICQCRLQHVAGQVNKDVRRMDLDRKPDGSAPDMERRADLCIFEATPGCVACAIAATWIPWQSARF